MNGMTEPHRVPETRCDPSEGSELTSKHIHKYSEFYESARYNNSLGTNTTTLLHLATALALGCEP